MTKMARIGRFAIPRTAGHSLTVRVGGALMMLAAAVAPVHGQTAREIVDRVDRLLRGESSRGEVEMEIVTEHWSRTLQMRIWSLGTERALIRLIMPRKDAGTATLKVGTEIWNYLPRVDRTIRIPPSLMGGAWMGSHFTNDDIVKGSRIVEDYDIAIEFEGEREGEAVWDFSLTPKPEAAVVWGRIVQRVRQRDYMPLWARYYDEDGELVREITFDEFRNMGGRTVPALTIITPADKPEERTVIRYTNLEFDISIEPSFFSLRRLRSDRG